MGIEGLTASFMFDIQAAVVVFELESDAYRRSSSKSEELSWSMKQKAEERYKRQEEVARQQAEARGLVNGRHADGH
jgi:hypothetical protein